MTAFTLKPRQYGEPISAAAPGFNPAFHQDLVLEINQVLTNLKDNLETELLAISPSLIGPPDADPARYSFRRASATAVEFYDKTLNKWTALQSSGGSGTGTGSGGSSSGGLVKTSSGNAFTAQLSDLFGTNPLTGGVLAQIAGNAPTYDSAGGFVKLEGSTANHLAGYVGFPAQAVLDASLDVTINADYSNYRHGGMFVSFSGSAGVNGYRFAHLVNAGGPSSRAILSVFLNGTETTLNVVTANIDWALGRAYRFRVLINFASGRVQLWIDGAPMIDYLDTVRAPAGVPGLFAYSGSFSYDNLSVMAPAANVSSLPAGWLLRSGTGPLAASGQVVLNSSSLVHVTDPAGLVKLSVFMSPGDLWSYTQSGTLSGTLSGLADAAWFLGGR